MLRASGIVAIIGVSVLMLLAVACSNGEAATTPETPPVADTTAPAQAGQTVVAPTQAQPAQDVAPAPPVESGQAAGSASLPADKSPVAASAPAIVDVGGSSGLPAPALLQTTGSEAGIWVTGQGSISLEPDLVLLNIGVETMRETVAEARNDAATAMAAIVQAVKARGLEDKDIQTRSFNIWPRYEYPEVTISGSRTRTQVLVGYTVSNTEVIKIRDLDVVGHIIDDVSGAGGDATRINGINFTIEDPKPHMFQLREDAVKDAIAKAEQLARLTGVSVGNLLFISEAGAGAPVVRAFAVAEGFAIARAAAPPTSISGGELELSLSVQAVFAIQ